MSVKAEPDSNTSTPAKTTIPGIRYATTRTLENPFLRPQNPEPENPYLQYAEKLFGVGSKGTAPRHPQGNDSGASQPLPEVQEHDSLGVQRVAAESTQSTPVKPVPPPGCTVVGGLGGYTICQNFTRITAAAHPLATTHTTPASVKSNIQATSATVTSNIQAASAVPAKPGQPAAEGVAVSRPSAPVVRPYY